MTKRTDELAPEKLPQDRKVKLIVAENLYLHAKQIVNGMYYNVSFADRCNSIPMECNSFINVKLEIDDTYADNEWSVE